MSDLILKRLRPRYHFSIPGNGIGYPGDSNGAFWHNGRYHLMYLFRRLGSQIDAPGQKHDENGEGFFWGHISSTNLVDWTMHGDAIGPSEAEPNGCLSGGGFINDDGTAYLIYWIFGERGLGIATSKTPFEHWHKLPQNPVVKSTSFGWTRAIGPDGQEQLYGSADPSNIWKSGSKYYFLAGNLWLLNALGRKEDSPEHLKGDCVYLFESENLVDWKYMHPFYQRRTDMTRATGWTDIDEDCMCPSFLPLPNSCNGGTPSGKYLLLFISHNRGCQYYIGDYRNDHFHPQSHGRMSWEDNTYFASEGLVDGMGRQIIWTWLLDNMNDDFEKCGWTGVYALPRSLWLKSDGTLGIAPVEELKQLRTTEKRWTNFRVPAGENRRLDGFSGNCCELEMEIAADSIEAFSLNVQVSDNGEEKTVIRYDQQASQLIFDASRVKPILCESVLNHQAIERAPLTLKQGMPLHLRVFIDGPVVEVFADDSQAICRRVYSAENGTRVIISAGVNNVHCMTIKAWDLRKAIFNA